MKRLPEIFVVVLLVLGIGILGYGALIGWWNNLFHVAAARTYYQEASQLPQDEIDQHFRRAYEHNEHLRNLGSQWFGAIAPIPADYTYILNVNGVMARLLIPSIAVDLPVLHTTTPETLARGVGHLEGSSFPIGGYGTHTALTTHSGIPNARLFNRLHELVIGDYFYIYVLNRRLVYRVDSITTILPNEIEALRIDPDADLVTLITCTPITVNTHRLLVRGARVQGP